MSASPRPTPAARRTVAPSGGSGSNIAQSSSQSNLLINVIRTLTTSVSSDQKEYEKNRLEKGHRDSGQVIDRLVKEHQKDVEECIDSFRDVSTKILSCRERIQNVRTALQTCKSLLECRRDDLKKLWLENSQQKFVCDILNELERIRDEERRVGELVTRKEFVEAALIVGKNRDLLSGRYAAVEGLSQLRANLDDSAKCLTQTLIEDIAQLLILDPFEKLMFEVLKELSANRIEESPICSQLAARAREAATRPATPEALKARFDINLDALNRLGEVGSVLNQVRTLSSSLFTRAVAQTVALVRARSSTTSPSTPTTVNTPNVSTTTLDADSALLAQLVALIVDQLAASRSSHQTFAQSLSAYDSIDFVMREYWSEAQSVLEGIIADHLDVSPVATAAKTNAPVTKKILFRFDASASATASAPSQGSSLVCAPRPSNMLAMYPVVSRFLEDVEEATGDKPCKLRRYVHSYVMEMLIERVKVDLEVRTDLILRSADCYSSLVDAPSHSTKVLASTERLLTICTEVHALVEAMDAYASRFASLWLLVLNEYTKSVQHFYERTTRLGGDISQMGERRTISAAWAADEDISRLLKSLPNWLLLAATNAQSLADAQTPALESEHEILERNARESEILIGNLGTQKQLDKAELITEHNAWRALAALHESLRWLAGELSTLLKSLPSKARKELQNCQVQVRERDGAAATNESILGGLEERISRLSQVADSCLLTLHLETRVHCFFHLLPLAKPQRAVLPHDEFDMEVLELGKDLTSLHSLLGTYLQTPKLRYIFDGLGHLSASIFIHSSQHMTKLTENGRKRVCRNIFGVQQRLSQLTGRRESALDRARAFFELLAQSPDDLLAQILRSGATFSHIEYTYLLALAVRSHPVLSSQPGALDSRIQKLTEIMTNKAKQTTRL